jgi:hypothetical protein
MIFTSYIYVIPKESLTLLRIYFIQNMSKKDLSTQPLYRILKSNGITVDFFGLKVLVKTIPQQTTD